MDSAAYSNRKRLSLLLSPILNLTSALEGLLTHRQEPKLLLDRTLLETTLCTMSRAKGPVAEQQYPTAADFTPSMQTSLLADVSFPGETTQLEEQAFTGFNR